MPRRLNKITGLMEDPEEERELEESGFYSEPHLRELGKLRQLDRIERMLKWLIITKINDSNPCISVIREHDFELLPLPDISDIIKKPLTKNGEVNKRKLGEA